jgi:hypothetical protein
MPASDARLAPSERTSVVFIVTNRRFPSEKHAKTDRSTLEWRINSISMQGTSEKARFPLVQRSLLEGKPDHGNCKESSCKESRRSGQEGGSSPRKEGRCTGQEGSRSGQEGRSPGEEGRCAGQEGGRPAKKAALPRRPRPPRSAPPTPPS